MRDSSGTSREEEMNNSVGPARPDFIETARPQKDLLTRNVRGHLLGLGGVVGRCMILRISDRSAWKRLVESTSRKKLSRTERSSVAGVSTKFEEERILAIARIGCNRQGDVQAMRKGNI